MFYSYTRNFRLCICYDVAYLTITDSTEDIGREDLKNLLASREELRVSWHTHKMKLTQRILLRTSEATIHTERLRGRWKWVRMIVMESPDKTCWFRVSSSPSDFCQRSLVGGSYLRMPIMQGHVVFFRWVIKMKRGYAQKNSSDRQTSQTTWTTHGLEIGPHASRKQTRSQPVILVFELVQSGPML